MSRMGHGEAMLAAISANQKKEEAERMREVIGKQNVGEVPALSRGYVRATNIDKAYEVFGHGPLLQSLPKDRHEYKEATPVAATVFNPAAALGYTPDDTQRSEVIKDMSRVNDRLFEDLMTLGVMFTAEADVSKKEGVSRYTNYIAVPDFITTGDAQMPLTKDTKSLGKFLTYLMTREQEGKALISPKEAMDTHGYGFLMEMTKPENIAQLKNELKLDFDAAMKKAYEQDPETVSRIVTYRMALGQLTPETVDQTYGHDIMMHASSKENVNWLRGLTGKAAGDLETTLPNVAKYLKRSESRDQTPPLPS